MERLRLLRIDYVNLNGSFEHLFGELRWLCWHYCPLKSLPSNFHLENLIALDMQHSDIKKFGPAIKFLKNLKVLNLSHSKYLEETPDFTRVSRLETLLLEGCLRLFEIHQSIGLLNRLICLSFKGCTNLRELPSSICNLISLEHLNVTGCSNLQELPDHLGNVQSLRELLAGGTAIKQLPFSCGILKNLTTLSLHGTNQNLPTKSWRSVISSWVSPRRQSDPNRLLPPSIASLSSLTRLNLSDCNLCEGDISADLGSLSSLKELDLERNSFRSLPSSLCHLSKLQILSLDNCKSLQSLTELPINLQRLDASGCTSMEKLPNLSSCKRLAFLRLPTCNRLSEIQGLENLDSMRAIHLESCKNLAHAFMDSVVKGQSEHNSYNVFLPSKEIPDWFSHQTMGSSICFDMPLHLGHKFLGMTLWAIYASTDEVGGFTTAPYANIYDKSNGGEWILSSTIFGIPITKEEHSWVSFVPQRILDFPMEGGERIEVYVQIEAPMEVKKCGIHLVCKTKS